LEGLYGGKQPTQYGTPEQNAFPQSETALLNPRNGD
jgi:hypothetical protein